MWNQKHKNHIVRACFSRKRGSAVNISLLYLGRRDIMCRTNCGFAKGITLTLTTLLIVELFRLLPSINYRPTAVLPHLITRSQLDDLLKRAKTGPISIKLTFGINASLVEEWATHSEPASTQFHFENHYEKAVAWTKSFNDEKE